MAKQVIFGTAGNDDLISGTDGDFIIALSGNDIIRSGSGAPGEFYGGDGDDLYIISNGDTIVEGIVGGNDTVQTALAFYILSAANVENLTGSSNSGQTLVGNSGANRITGGTGIDEMQGGAGDDSYVVLNAGDTIVEAISGGNDTIETTLSAFDLNWLSNVENLTGLSSSGQSLIGTAGANRINGGTGVDEMVGGDGDDTYAVRNIGDTVVEGVGGGTDTIEFTLQAYDLTWVTNFENLTGLLSTGQSLVGNSGANRIDGGAGNDEMQGGDGDDVYVVRNAGDTIIEAANKGTDTVETSLTSYSLAMANVENLTGTGVNQTLIGNALDNRITANGAGNTLRGGAGNDTYVLTEANSIIENAGEGTDTVITTVSLFTLSTNVENVISLASGNFQANGNDLNNEITGNDGNDLLRGNNGNDTLNGGNGNDTLRGENGYDILTGGAGADHFVFQSSLIPANADTILDFERGVDLIDLDRSVFSTLSLGALPAGAFVAGTAALDADDRIIYDPDTATLYFDRDGTGSAAATAFATVGYGIGLQASDFNVIG